MLNRGRPGAAHRVRGPACDCTQLWLPRAGQYLTAQRPRASACGIKLAIRGCLPNSAGGFNLELILVRDLQSTTGVMRPATRCLAGGLDCGLGFALLRSVTYTKMQIAFWYVTVKAARDIEPA